MTTDQALAICPFCHEVVGAPTSFAHLWHIGRDLANTPSCCLVGEHQRQVTQQEHVPEQPFVPSGGPINVAPRGGAPQRPGQTSPLIIVDESQIR